MANVEALFIGSEEGGAVGRVDSVRAVAGHGLEGDRYYNAQGDGDPSLEITLFEAEAVEDVRSPELDVQPEDMRRNVMTRGVELRSLIGRKFSVGEVVVEGLEDNPPCRRLQRLAGKKLLKPLIERGGIRGRIVTSGTIEPGDEIVPADA